MARFIALFATVFVWSLVHGARLNRKKARANKKLKVDQSTILQAENREGEENVDNAIDAEAGFCINSMYLRNGGSDRFYRMNSNKAELGSYGRIPECAWWNLACTKSVDFMSPPGCNWLDDPNVVGLEKVQVETNIKLSSKQVSKFEADGQVAAAVSVAEKAKVNAGMTYNSTTSHQLQAVVLSFKSREQLKTDINACPASLQHLKDYKNPRIAGAIIKLTGQGNVGSDGCDEFHGGGGGWNITGSSAEAGGSTKNCMKATTSFSRGTVIGYKLLQPKWNKEKTRIVDLSWVHPCSRLDLTCGCNVWSR